MGSTSWHPLASTGQPDRSLIDHFERHGIMNNARIVSKCRKCGVMIVGTVSDGLADQERDHMKSCGPQETPSLPGASLSPR